MRELFRRLQFFLRRDSFERELDEEMRHHLDLQAEESGGLDSARRRFGNITLLKEESRAMWSWSFLDQTVQDVRYALRAMAASPAFTAMAVLSLALGIGANTAIYSFLDAVLLRSLPVIRPHELVVLEWRSKDSPSVIHGHRGTRDRDKTGVFSPNYPFAAYEYLRSDSAVLSSLFAYATAWQVNLVARRQAEVANGQFVSGSFYRDLGVSPALGRLIDNADDRPGAPRVAVLSYRYWQTRYASDPSAIGQAIEVNNVPFTIVGVSAPEFFGVNPGREHEVYMPLHAAPSLAPRPSEDETRRFFDGNFYWVEMMGRLQPGITRAQAETVLAGKFRQFVVSTASTDRERTNLPELWLMDGAGGLDSLRRQYSQPLYVLMAMVGLILAIACANIANLLLARAAARRREIAVRLSIGAGRMRLVRQLLTESILLAVFGAALGLLVADWGIRSTILLLGMGAEDLTLRANLNWSVLAFTCGLTMLTGIIFGLAPALQATKVDVAPALKETTTNAPSGHSRRMNLGRVLLVLQFAFSLLLVIGAGLFVRTLSNLRSVELGFNQRNLLLFSLNARQAGYKEASLARFYDDLLQRFRRIPGVQEAAMSQFSLLTGYWNSTNVEIPGIPSRGPKTETCILPVDANYLATMQIPILLGTGIGERQIASPNVAVVNEEFVKKFLAGENPVGRRIALGSAKRDVEIIGVARTALYNSIKEKTTPPLAYIPYTQDLPGLGGMFFQLRVAGDPLALTPAIRRIVHDANANVPVAHASTQIAEIDRMIRQERTFGRLCSSFAVLALTIACIGLYGAMAYMVARRTSEIGIRMALGAERRSIVAMVLRDVLALVLAGAIIGLGLAWATTRFLESFLFGLKHNDPLVLSIAIVCMAVAAVLAGYAPAHRASRIDPMLALRHE